MQSSSEDEFDDDQPLSPISSSSELLDDDPDSSDRCTESSTTEEWLLDFLEVSSSLFFVSLCEGDSLLLLDDVIDASLDDEVEEDDDDEEEVESELSFSLDDDDEDVDADDSSSDSLMAKEEVGVLGDLSFYWAHGNCLASQSMLWSDKESLLREPM